ncbi:MAG: hypothetical protein EOP92_21220 [Lysobacteraceae bacterium]|nr:MAG: hypothetical protein EOP92_21220 [Xanthomonadaceae bacterium]
MSSGFFFAQDQAGNMQKVHVVRHSPVDPAESGGRLHAAAYALDDGSPVRRIDSDTFQVIDTGALVTMMRA